MDSVLSTENQDVAPDAAPPAPIEKDIRDSKGCFAKGNRHGRGGYAHAGQVAAIRAVLFDVWNPAAVREVAEAMLRRAKSDSDADAITIIEFATQKKGK